MLFEESIRSIDSILLIASWLNSLLYTLEVILVVYYFSQCNNGPGRRYLVIGLLCADTVSTLAVCSGVWLELIKHSSVENSPHGHWSVPIIILSTAVVALTEDLFLIHRFRKMSQNLWLSALMLILTILQAIVSVMSGVLVSIDPSNKSNLFFALTAVKICVTAAVDLLIPLALLWQLYTITPAFIAKQRFGRRLIVNAISSGCCCALMGIALLVTFWLKSSVFLIIMHTIGRVYTLTVLVNLLVPVIFTRNPSLVQTALVAELPINNDDHAVHLSATIFNVGTTTKGFGGEQLALREIRQSSQDIKLTDSHNQTNNSTLYSSRYTTSL